MFSSLKKNPPKASASVVDGKLILSFPEALTPIVWQMDLADAKASAFEILEEEGKFVLSSRKPGAQKKDVIASFSSRTDAVEGLMATSRALESAHGLIRMDAPAANINAPVSMMPPPVTHTTAVYHAPPKAKGSGGRWIISAVCIVVIIGIFASMNSMRMRTPSSVSNAGGLTASSAAASAAQSGHAADAAGVPVSADEFLMRR